MKRAFDYPHSVGERGHIRLLLGDLLLTVDRFPNSHSDLDRRFCIGNVTIGWLVSMFGGLLGKHEADHQQERAECTVGFVSHGVIERLNDKTQPRRADDVARESGTASATRRWLQ
jgi:hypothetical protein